MHRTLARTAAALVVGLATAAAPASAQSVVDVLKSQPGFTIFSNIVERSGLTSQLSAPGNFTVFAPADNAFWNISFNQRQQLQSGTDQAALQRFVLSHVATGQPALAFTMPALRNMPSMAGSPIRVTTEQNSNEGGGGTTVTTANGTPLAGEVRATNGRIHFIGQILQ